MRKHNRLIRKFSLQWGEPQRLKEPACGPLDGFQALWKNTTCRTLRYGRWCFLRSVDNPRPQAPPTYCASVEPRSGNWWVHRESNRRRVGHQQEAQRQVNPFLFTPFAWQGGRFEPAALSAWIGALEAITVREDWVFRSTATWQRTNRKRTGSAAQATPVLGRDVRCRQPCWTETYCLAAHQSRHTEPRLWDADRV